MLTKSLGDIDLNQDVIGPLNAFLLILLQWVFFQPAAKRVHTSCGIKGMSIKFEGMCASGGRTWDDLNEGGAV